MRWTRLLRIEALSCLFVALGCSGGAAEVASPKSDVAPIPTATASAAAPRPSPCDVAALLVAKADELRDEGYLARAARALDDAEARCPAKAKELVGRVRAQVNDARSVRDEETPDSILNDMQKKAVDASWGRRRHERWLTALDRDAGTTTRLAAADTSAPIGFAWSRDGSRAAVLRGDDLSIYDGDLRKEEGRYLLGTGDRSMAWLPSGKGVIVGDQQANFYRTLDLATKKLGPRVDVGAPFSGLRVSPDEKTLVIDGPKLLFWDLAAKKAIGALSFAVPAMSVAWSPSGDKVAVGLSDGQVEVRAFPALTPIVTIAPLDEQASPAFQSEKRLFVVAHGKAATFEIPSGKRVGKLLEGGDSCEGIAYGESGAGVLWACYAMLHVEDALTGKERSLYTPSTDAHLYTSFDGMSVAPDGGSVWYSLWGEQYLVDLKTGKQIASVSAPTVFGMHIRPGSKRLAAIDNSGTTLWTSDLRSDERTVLKPGFEPPTCSRLGVDGLGAAVFADVHGPDDGLPGDARIALRGAGIDAPKAPAMRILECPAAMSEDASRIAVIDKDELRVVRTNGWSTEAVIALDPKTDEHGTISRDGKRAVVWGKAGARVIDVATKSVLATWKEALDPRVTVDVSPSGKRVLVVDGKRGWLFEVGRAEATPMTFTGTVAAFAGDDAIAEGAATAVHVHDLSTQETRTVAGPRMAFRIEVSPDGKRAVVVDQSHGWLVDLTGATGLLVNLGWLDRTKQIVFFPSARAVAIFDPATGVAWLHATSTGAPLGSLRRGSTGGAVYRSELGNVEMLGAGAGDVSCLREPSVLPFEDCADRYVEKGLFARTMAGRGCTSEDVGDVCE